MKMQLEQEKKWILKGKKEQAFRKKKQQMTEKENRQQKQAPVSWKNSEAIQHMYGENSMETKEKTTGLYDRLKEHSSEQKMREVFHAENSYGNIAVGANKKKEAMIVVSQEREHNGITTKEHQKKLNMERNKRKISPKGDFFTNNSHFDESAWAYKGKTELPDKKAFDEIKNYTEKEESKMLEKRMPFLLLEKDKKQMVNLQEQIRESHENGNKADARILEKQKETLQHEIRQKEENEKTMRKKIKFAWEKARKAMAEDFEMQKSSHHKEKEEENNLELPNTEENSGKGK